ncbi:MAG TPA: diaminobutyrate acetyltransferase [Methanophagales archaeon]|nr:diaminobutyrate acetyltransferase [Methanophagales archaeon]
MSVSSIAKSGSIYTGQNQLVFRKPEVKDATKIHALINTCKPLALNSVYCYLLLCQHFADTCVVAEEKGEIIAFLSGYRLPSNPKVLFVWQVAVDSRVRGGGIGKRLLREVLQRTVCHVCHFIETTITLSNTASWHLFRSFARDLEAYCEGKVYFSNEHFGEENYETEYLLRIGPFNINREDSK